MSPLHSRPAAGWMISVKGMDDARLKVGCGNFGSIPVGFRGIPGVSVVRRGHGVWEGVSGGEVSAVW